MVAGFRRMSNQQIQPLTGLNVPITPQIIDEHKWDAFWDAPLDLNPQPATRREPAARRGDRQPARAAAQGGGDHARDRRPTAPIAAR